MNQIYTFFSRLKLDSGRYRFSIHQVINRLEEKRDRQMDFSSSSDNVGADSNSSKDIVCKSDSGARFLVNDRGMLDVD